MTILVVVVDVDGRCRCRLSLLVPVLISMSKEISSALGGRLWSIGAAVGASGAKKQYGVLRTHQSSSPIPELQWGRHERGELSCRGPKLSMERVQWSWFYPIANQFTTQLHHNSSTYRFSFQAAIMLSTMDLFTTPRAKDSTTRWQPG